MRVQYSIIMVADMARSVAFYRDVIGMPLRFETPQWTEFATEGATFALHTADEGTATPEVPLGAGTCRPGFSVDDLDAFHARMQERDVPCLQEPTEVFGVRIAQYRDPDGLPLSVSDGGA